MRLEQISQIASTLRNGGRIEDWLARNPDANVEEACGVAMLIGRVAFPSIQGNPPLDKTRPYLDLRRLQADNLHFEADLL